MSDARFFGLLALLLVAALAVGFAMGWAAGEEHDDD